MARMLEYFAPGWRSESHDCGCGWRGNADAMTLEPYEDVSDYSCPGCGNLLLIVPHPDMEQVQRAAAEGNTEAQQQLALVEEALQQRRN